MLNHGKICIQYGNVQDTLSVSTGIHIICSNTWSKIIYGVQWITCFILADHYNMVNHNINTAMYKTGGWFNIKMPSYQYRKSHCGDETILRPSYLHNGISYTGNMTSLYWIRALISPMNTCKSILILRWWIFQKLWNITYFVTNEIWYS